MSPRLPVGEDCIETGTGMAIRALILGCIFFCSSPLLAQEKDLIVMKNGDRFTGEIKGLSGGTLSISLNYVDGNIAVQWSEVDHLESSRLFVVKTESGVVYTGNGDGKASCKPKCMQYLHDIYAWKDLQRVKLRSRKRAFQLLVKMARTQIRISSIVGQDFGGTEYQKQHGSCRQTGERDKQRVEKAFRHRGHYGESAANHRLELSNLSHERCALYQTGHSRCSGARSVDQFLLRYYAWPVDRPASSEADHRDGRGRMEVCAAIA